MGSKVCNHDGLFTGYPEDEEFFKLSTSEIRKKYPRIICKKCNTIIYKSKAHYVCGDY